MISYKESLFNINFYKYNVFFLNQIYYFSVRELLDCSHLINSVK